MDTVPATEIPHVGVSISWTLFVGQSYIADASENVLHLTSQSARIDLCAGAMFQSGQLVRVNLAGLQAEGVMFQAAVTDAVGHIVKQTAEQPPKYLVKLLFSFRGVSEVEVPAARIHAQS
jgi:hypothetical protein